MNTADMDQSQVISEMLCSRLCDSKSMDNKCSELELQNIRECLGNTLAVLFIKDPTIITGSAGEGTDITSVDYGKSLCSSQTLSYVSDMDVMQVLNKVRVIDEGEPLPQRFDNYIYFQAERGEHTTDGFRKLRTIHSPQYYSARQYRADNWEDGGYISSSLFLTTLKTGCDTQGPSHITLIDGSPNDFVTCFYVSTWPPEAESWFTRQTHWPDQALKSKIRKIGYLLVPIGNRKSQESDLEWRCSFSIAEKMLFQSLTKFQRCTFFMLKVLLKEYLPSDINTDGEKQLLSTYHIKTLFLWCLEHSKVKWESEDMLANIGYMLDILLRFINQKYFPHYFIFTINLLDGTRLHGKGKPLISHISDITNDLPNKIMQSQFFMGQEINLLLGSKINNRMFFMYIHENVMHCIIGKLQILILRQVFENILFTELHFSHSVLVEGVISVKSDVDPWGQHLYTSIYSDPVCYKLLMKAAPGFIDQYRGCMHLAKYCMAARDGLELQEVLHTAESLLKSMPDFDLSSGYVKLACLYIVTQDFIQAMDKLHAAEKHFLLIHKNMVTSALRNLQLKGIEVDQLTTELFTASIDEVFQKWTEGQVTSDIVVTWPEYITVPDFIQFELIHECTKQVIDLPDRHCKEPGKMVALESFLQCPPLSFIKLLKFVCTLHQSQFSISHMEYLVADLIASSLSLVVGPSVNDIFTVFNMAAWCYVKIKKYKPASRMMTVTIDSRKETEIMKRCAFSHHFLAYVIAQCLDEGRRVLVYTRDTQAR